MKFQRINEDTVRCIVNQKDMQEFGIRLEDFFKNKSKVHDFLHEVVERAGEEIGYTPKEGMLSMQIIPINPSTISITFTESSEEYTNMLDSIKGTLGAGFDEEMLAGPDTDEDDEYDGDGPEGDGPDSMAGALESSAPGDGPKALDMTKSSIILIAMTSIEKMADYCRTLNIDKTVSSELYYLKNKDVYCMIINKARLSENDMRRILLLAVEYTSNITDESVVISHVKEYGEPIISKFAYRILKKFI